MIEQFREPEPIEEEPQQRERTLEELLQPERLYEDVETVAAVELTEEEKRKERVLCVLDQVFSGNQSRMGGEIGVAPSLLNKVSKGVQPATDELMRRIASIPGLNQQWVLTGEAMMFQNPIATLPVSEKFLQGTPKEWKAELTGNRFGVPSDFARESCYYYKIGPGSDLLKFPGGEYKAGDLLLIETDREVIEKIGCAKNRFFVVRIRMTDGERIAVYGKMDVQEDGERVLKLHDTTVRLKKIIVQPDEFEGRKVRRRVRLMKPEDYEPVYASSAGMKLLDEDKKNDPPKVEDVKPKPIPVIIPEFYWHDVIGIQLMLLRT